MWKVNLKNLIAGWILSLVIICTASGAVIVVNPGESIQAAIESASYGDTVEVSAGTYIERITLKNGVAVIGAGDDVSVIDANGSGRVVYSSGCDANTVLEGFTITGGLASNGGGMYNLDSSPTIKDCTFSGNRTDNGIVGDPSGPGGNAGHGGGMYNDSSSPFVTNCTFQGNTTGAGGAGGEPAFPAFPGGAGGDGGNGAGIYNTNNSSAMLVNCIFTGNAAGDGGDGADGGDGIASGMFGGNGGAGGDGGKGGGVYNKISTATMINCIFNSNSTGMGGNGGNGGDAFADNPGPGGDGGSGGDGGAGGGVENYICSPVVTITNCTFNGNSCGAGGPGGAGGWGAPAGAAGAYGTDGSGGGMYNEAHQPAVTNCILWGDEPNEISNSGPWPIVTYCDVEGGTGQSWFGTGCIDRDPCFVDAAGGDFYLLFNSPCIDAGDNLAVPVDVTEDIEGNSRIIDGDFDSIATVDMGAYEYWCEEPPMEIWVDFKYHAVGYNDGHIWGYDAFAVIQYGINAAVYGSKVYVADGSYVENITLKNGVALIGAGAGISVIHAGGIGRVVASSGCDANTILEGFTITGGVATGEGPDNRGGGMYNSSSSPTVTNCTFSDNSASWSGGGMFNDYNSRPTVTNCTFTGNTASHVIYGGGGMYNNDNSSPTVTNCTFSGNSAYYGGGMFNEFSNPTLTNCTFSGNIATGDYGSGGGMFNYNYSSPTVTNCTFSGNIAATGDYGSGGGMYNENNSSPTVTNCIFTGNSASYDGGGMCNWWLSNPTVTNCTFSNNKADNWGGGMSNYWYSSSTVTNCTFSNNKADNWGGGMYNYDHSRPKVRNCTFSGNLSGYGGGGMFNNNECSPTMVRCTFSGNSAGTYGGGMCNVTGSDLVMVNCIMWGDSAGTSDDEIFNSDSTFLIRYSNIAGCGGSGAGWNGSIGTDGGGNIDAEPLFFAPAIDDFHLKSEFGRVTMTPSVPFGTWVVDTVTSPCIDAGNPNTDVGNEPEGNGDRINMGRYGGTYQASKSSYIGPVEGDVNGDGKVDFKDIAVVAGNWLAGTEPEL